MRFIETQPFYKFLVSPLFQHLFYKVDIRMLCLLKLVFEEAFPDEVSLTILQEVCSGIGELFALDCKNFSGPVWRVALFKEVFVL